MSTLGTNKSFVLVQEGSYLVALGAEWIRPLSLISAKPELNIPGQIRLEDNTLVDLIPLTEERLALLYHGGYAQSQAPAGVQLVATTGSAEAATMVGRLLESFDHPGLEGQAVKADDLPGEPELAQTVKNLERELAQAQQEITNLRTQLRDQLAKLLAQLEGRM